MRSLAIACVALLAVPTMAAANPWQDQVQGKIQTAGTDLETGGWKLDRAIHMDALADDETGFMTLNLSGYSRYKILAAGDRDCSDLDVYVYDSEDNLIDHNVSPANMVEVDLDPEQTGEYRIMVKMDDCLAEPCSYGVAVFSD